MSEAINTRLQPKDASASIGPPTTPLKPATSRGVTARAVYTVLRNDDEIHSMVMEALRKLGGSVDRWQPQDKRHMAHAISLAEDALEMRRGRRDDLTSALRSIRRQLECECWP